MKSNDWRHKNVARYTPGNTKILYFFNCLLDGMHTKIKHICDFSRSGLNARLCACIQTLLRGHKYALFISLSSAHWQLRKSVNRMTQPSETSLKSLQKQIQNSLLILPVNLLSFNKRIFYQFFFIEILPKHIYR